MNSYPSPSSSLTASAQPFVSALLYDTSSAQMSAAASNNTSHASASTSASPTMSSSTFQPKLRLLPPNIGTTGLVSPINQSLPPPYPLSAGPTVSQMDFRNLAVELDRERAQLHVQLQAERERGNQLRNALRRHQSEIAQMNDAYAQYQQVADILRRRSATLESELAAARDAVHMASREAAREQDLRIRFENELDHCRRAIRDAAQRAIEVLVFAADGDLETQQVARDVALWRSQARDSRNGGLAATLVPVTHIKTVLSKLEEYAKQWRNDRNLFLRTRLHEQQQQEVALAASIAASNISNSLNGHYNGSRILSNMADRRDAVDRRYSTSTSAECSSGSVNMINTATNSDSMCRAVTPFGMMTDEIHATSGGSTPTTSHVNVTRQDGFGGDFPNLESSSESTGTSVSPLSSQAHQSTTENDHGHTIIRNSFSNVNNTSNNCSLDSAASAIWVSNMNGDSTHHDNARSSKLEGEIVAVSDKNDNNPSHVLLRQNDVIDSPTSSMFAPATTNGASASSNISKARSDSAASAITLASFWPSTWSNGSSKIDPPPGLGIKEPPSSKWSEVVKGGGDSLAKVSVLIREDEWWCVSLKLTHETTEHNRTPSFTLLSA
ncbi:hypothetical protein SeLEV6574_g00746 [Synchytrium endobioticum]|uniref:Uncharacterized protein n=1 Tax=Synchytrium endobioticum TaxID=286115 RepID=A0A507DG42_9FUNG|nr:hypothetical protein SeLEV6574_g00746 [Synchytrium endobioticum]